MKLSIVFPCKDQTAKLVHNLTSVVLKFFDFSSIDYEILIVSDGSDEANQNALVKAVKDLPSKVKLVSYQDKKGKGLPLSEVWSRTVLHLLPVLYEHL